MLIEEIRPQASVVMTVYNDLRFLDEAVDSILNQDFPNLELVIVDDGTGQTELFAALERRDPRIRLVVNPTNLGTAAAGNIGIAAARADIIMRLDADDIAEPSHVGRLLEALAQDSQLGLVGSWVTLIDEAGHAHVVQRMPETDLEIRWTMLFHNPFYHSTVAFRRSCFDAAGGYRPEELVSQDHYLWFAMLPFCRVENIAAPLTRYRINPRGLTVTNSIRPRNRTHPIREALWAQLGLTYDLYDDAIARDQTDFLRGFEVAVDRRPVAYVAILKVLRIFLARPQPYPLAEDGKAARVVTTPIIQRMFANSPASRRDRIAILRLCWAIDRHATRAAIATYVTAAFWTRTRAARQRLRRATPR